MIEDQQRQCLAAAIDIYAQMRELPHVIQLSLHPAYGDLAEPILKFALHQLAQVSINPVLIGSYEIHRAKQDAIKALGFKKLTSDFLMVRDNLEKLVLPSPAEAQVLKSMNLADG